ncbi:37S ribosomal protein S24, mitochondrial [Malassezia yamatoensis]|uniref:37S ribosomal protein S24, mitochondrial n=1 Tax=Malassezia yamatoensis TaxID=253288 RepID=A0AAJ5YRI4_9BASI|nr:37S ribosomal protein S24, mitochondrial [Malassezia yamatoensis]
MKLQKQRQLLDYYRLLENEVPQLRQYHEPFQPATETDVLQFHFTHYQGEPHPGAQKVVVTANVHELWKAAKLSSPQAKHKFLLLAGARWQPADLDVVQSLNSALEQGGDTLAKAYDTHSLGSIRIGCNRCPHETQNMKWCSDVLDKMIAEAQTGPSLMDVPLDIRPYIRSNARGGPVARASAADFPKEWL